LLRCSSKQAAASKLSSQAPELAAIAALQQSKVTRNKATHNKATRSKAPQPGFGACCVAAKQRATKQRVASKQASKKKKKTSYLFVCAWVPLQLQ
jgi:hypothetical protein